MRDIEPSPNQRKLDRLTAENDRLREFLIRLREGKTLTVREWALVDRHQIAHRKEDLARLENTLRAAIADQKALGREGGTDLHAKLGLVVTADPKQPLEPQLGFDPDSI
jgi:hypothetical protein